MYKYSFKHKEVKFILDDVDTIILRGEATKLINSDDCFIVERQDGLKQIACSSEDFPDVKNLKVYDDGNGMFIINHLPQAQEFSFCWVDDTTISVGKRNF